MSPALQLAYALLDTAPGHAFATTNVSAAKLQEFAQVAFFPDDDVEPLVAAIASSAITGTASCVD